MNCGPYDILEAKIHLFMWLAWRLRWRLRWRLFFFLLLVSLREPCVWRAITACTWRIWQWNFVRLFILFLWFQKPITHLIWSFYVKVMLEEVREGWLSWKVGIETLKAHNYLVRRFLFFIFGVFMYWNLNFLKKLSLS